MDFIRDLHPEQSDPARFMGRDLEESVRHYIVDGIRTGSYIGYVGFVREEPACSAGLLLYRLPPLHAGVERLQGHVLNFFTLSHFRNRGVGMELMKFMIRDARSRGIYRLFLNATKMAESLYRKSGFYDPEEVPLLLEL